MNESWLATEFEEQRPQLRAVAYRMLGSQTEADDALQEAWLRLSRTDRAAVDNLGGWLTTVVGRICLDMLRTRRARREDYAGSWLPEPIVVDVDAPDPEQEALLADSVGLALLVVLDREGDDPERLRPAADDSARAAVDDRGPRERGEAGAAREDLIGDGLRAAEGLARERAGAASVDAEDDLGVEHGDQRLEVARA